MRIIESKYGKVYRDTGTDMGWMVVNKDISNNVVSLMCVEGLVSKSYIRVKGKLRNLDYSYHKSNCLPNVDGARRVIHGTYRNKMSPLLRSKLLPLPSEGKDIVEYIRIPTRSELDISNLESRFIGYIDAKERIVDIQAKRAIWERDNACDETTVDDVYSMGETELDYYYETLGDKGPGKLASMADGLRFQNRSDMIWGDRIWVIGPNKEHAEYYDGGHYSGGFSRAAYGDDWLDVYAIIEIRGDSKVYGDYLFIPEPITG